MTTTPRPTRPQGINSMLVNLATELAAVRQELALIRQAQELTQAFAPKPQDPIVDATLTEPTP